MENEQEARRVRESGGLADIGTPEDGAIINLIPIGNKVLIIKEKAIYELEFADSVDPDRTNIHLPGSIQKLVINKGVDSEVVAKTFLTAKNIFDKKYIDNNIDCDKVLSISLDLMSELSVLEDEINSYLQEEKNVSDIYNKRVQDRDMSSYQIPSILNLESKCKTIFQKADHVEQTLMEIITHFYPGCGLTKQSHYPKFHGVLLEKYGPDDDFVNFIGRTLDFMKVTREIRNGLDHRLATCRITNFELQPNGVVYTPTIKLDARNAPKLEEVPIREALTVTKANLIDVTEKTFAFLAARNVHSDSRKFYVMKEIPEDKRKNKLVRYAFWLAIGPDGLYCQ